MENGKITPDDRPLLILHIGQTKAGSTAVQNYLDHQRDALLDQGFLFPAYGFSRANPYDSDRTSGHLALIRQIAADGAHENKELEALQAHDKLILSAENLFLDCRDSELSALGAFFCHHRIVVVLVVRSIGSWLVSRYAEDVMSGFKSITATFADFQDRVIAAGLQNYGSRLDEVVELLKAAEVRLINYDTTLSEKGIVPAFLQTAGLPVTDPDLAHSVRSNISENTDILLESKRRLNHVISDLPLVTRLKMEKRLRDHAKTIDKTHSASSLSVSLPLEACEDVMKSNRHLVGNYGLTSPLDDIYPACLDEYSHRASSGGTDALVSAGFGIIAEQLCISDGANPDEGNMPLLSMPGITLVTDLLANAGITLHLDSPETAMWAACYDQTLPLLMATKIAHEKLDELTLLTLPSDVVCATAPEQLAKVLRSRSPEVVVAQSGSAPKDISGFLKAARDDAHLVLLGHDKAEVAPFIEELDLEIAASSGKIYVLVRSSHAPNYRQYPA